MDDILEGNWKQLKGTIKEWWGRLTDDDLMIIEGNRDQLVGRLQERYGWTREQAEADVRTRLNEYERTLVS
jgi:uncharacterized protein YjbJ (UPF0337 family)